MTGLQIILCNNQNREIDRRKQIKYKYYAHTNVVDYNKKKVGSPQLTIFGAINAEIKTIH